MEKSLEKQIEIIKRGSVEIISEDELIEKVKNSIKKNIPLNIKLGLDPSSPDIHLGHTVVLNKMRQLQDLGHKCFLIIGDFTGQIGDPTGKSIIRKQITKEKVLLNSKTYKKQIFKILNEKKTKVVFNSDWLENMSFSEIIKLSSKTTVARILERDDFKNRYLDKKPISMHEIFYPLIQSYDSVIINSDIEIGGTDQKFNLLMGRHIQKEYNQNPQVAITMPILEGTDGIQKMSKSIGNYIGINESSKNIFGKIMSIKDELIIRYFELLVKMPICKINEIKILIKSGANPKDFKILLAKEIIKIYFNKNIADEEEKNFFLIFSKKEIPNKIDEYIFEKSEIYWLPKLLNKLKAVNSNADGKRILEQGGIKINGKKYTKEEVLIKNKMVLQIGKRRFIRIIIK